MAVVAVLLVVFRETSGRLEIAGPVATGGSNSIVFEVSHPEEIRRLEDQFDEGVFSSLVKKRLDAAARQQEFGPTNFNVYLVDVEGALCIKYNYAHWGRNRFDLRELRYVFDGTDPIAQARNDAIEQAFFKAAKEWLRDQPAIVRLEHYGRLHQVVSKGP
jgi:hypothetical protein